MGHASPSAAIGHGASLKTGQNPLFSEESGGNEEIARPSESGTGHPGKNLAPSAWQGTRHAAYETTADLAADGAGRTFDHGLGRELCDEI